ncbi:gll1431 [Gloeobacter violaceus PCC 7421]|uniref:Gll1431 protein n=2 Tax=Gloeobacter violaceus TaxID=33072 RepID=Q7NKP6_GLOVI|nr:gll1431 [Gloeobacter violaceus PCC 7421]
MSSVCNGEIMTTTKDPSESKVQPQSEAKADAKTGMIRFQLLAPYNEKAALVGSFSNWEEIPMEKDDKGCFFVEIDLPDGEHQYKFKLVSKSFFCEGETVAIADPYARQVDEKNRENTVIRIKDGKQITDEYVWEHDDVPLSPDDHLIIYELHVSAFGGDTFIDAIQQLDYLVDLGVNCVQLMPVTEYPGEHYWGYNPRHPFAPESSYGKPEDLKAFVDACHERGFRVILDIVLNHSESESPLTRIDFTYWFYAPGTEPDEPGNVWGPKFNLEFYDEHYKRNPAREYLYDLVDYWVREYHIDGYRIDAAAQIKYFDFLGEVARRSKANSGGKPFYLVGEHIPENPAITGADGPMDGAYHETYYWMIDDLMVRNMFDTDQIVDSINPLHHGYPGPSNAVNFYENHDKPRLLQRLRDAGINEEGSFKRLECAAALLMTSVGLPMLYQGQAMGQAYPQDEEVHAVEWTLLDHDRHVALLERYKGLIDLRRETQALWTNEIDFFHIDQEARVIAYVRFNAEGSRVAVVAHLGDGNLGDYQVPCFPEDGHWFEKTRLYEVDVEGGILNVHLSDWDVHVFRNGG